VVDEGSLGYVFSRYFRFFSVRFILWMLHMHILCTYYCRCIILATDSIFKQYSWMQAHMTYSPTQNTHTHTHTIAFNSCHIYRHQTYRHCSSSRFISTDFYFQHIAKYCVKFPHVPSNNFIFNVQYNLHLLG
jgi:hypothetical protein